MTFYDPVESTFYGWCVERLLTSPRLAPLLTDGIVEIGAGTAVPVVDALRRSASEVRIQGFERDRQAYLAAAATVAREALPNYTVVQGDFFSIREGPTGEGSVGESPRCAIGNPPYLPAAEAMTRAPGLWGGRNGSEVARQVLSCGFDAVMLMTASISDPIAVLEHGRKEGYTVRDWMIQPIPFGGYSRERTVRRRIAELAEEGRAFFAPDSYLLAGVTWTRAATAEPDGADVLERVLTSAGSAARIGREPGPPRLFRVPDLDQTWRPGRPGRPGISALPAMDA